MAITKNNKKYIITAQNKKNADTFPKLTWINFLHIYQPVNTDAHIIKEATDMSYDRIVRALEEHQGIRFTINISGCLFLRWEELGYHELIKRINRLIKGGQIDLTGTACYHPIIPLMPEKEIRRQIKENEHILKKHFGEKFKPRGFFFPELAYSPRTAKIIKDLGYEWILLDELAVNGTAENTNFNKIYMDKNSRLKVVVRSRVLSNSYVPEMITKLLKDKLKREEINSYAITATDGELYGLRYIDHTGEFEKLLKHKSLKTRTISNMIDRHTNTPTPIRPRSHSWATSIAEFKKKEPFNLWQEKTNTVHKKLWKLAYMAYNTIEKYHRDKNYNWARWHLVRGLASCSFWWASAKDFRMFGPLSWSPDEIERGTNELIRSIRALEDVATREDKIKAEKLYVEIKKMVWQRHWIYYWKKT